MGWFPALQGRARVAERGRRAYISGMSIRAQIGPLAAFLTIAVLAGASVLGWASHGEAIFLRWAEAAWATCF